MMISLLLMAALTCPLTITSPAEVYAKVYYLGGHPGGKRYVHTTFMVKLRDSVISVNPDGSPVAVVWYSKQIDQDVFRAVQTCGTVPSRIFPLIFQDGFEGGNTDAWSLVVGDE